MPAQTPLLRVVDINALRALAPPSLPPGFPGRQAPPGQHVAAYHGPPGGPAHGYLTFRPAPSTPATFPCRSPNRAAVPVQGMARHGEASPQGHANVSTWRLHG